MLRVLRFITLCLSIICFSACNGPPTPSTTPPPVSGGHDHGHDHGHHHGHSHDEGPNRGHIIELGDHEYHVEWTHEDETGELAIYLLDAAMKKPVAIEAKSLTVSVTIGDETRTHELTAAPAEAATSDRFTIIDKPLIEALKLGGQGVEAVMQVPIGDKTFEVKFEHDAH
jgi:hypothetical protein